MVCPEAVSDQTSSGTSEGTGGSTLDASGVDPSRPAGGRGAYALARVEGQTMRIVYDPRATAWLSRRRAQVPAFEETRSPYGRRRPSPSPTARLFGGLPLRGLRLVCSHPTMRSEDAQGVLGDRSAAWHSCAAPASFAKGGRSASGTSATRGIDLLRMSSSHTSGADSIKRCPGRRRTAAFPLTSFRRP